MRAALYVVPQSEPNADARCIDVTVDDFRSTSHSWLAASKQLAPYVPSGHFLVKYEIVAETA